MATVEIVDEKLQVFLPMGPNKENMIDKSHPDQWFVHRSLQQPLFQPKGIIIGRSKLRANCCPLLVPMYLTVKFKIVVSKGEGCQTNQGVSSHGRIGTLVWLASLVLSNMLYAVKRLAICFNCEFTSFIYKSCAKKQDIIIIIEFREFFTSPVRISARCYLIEISSTEMKSAPVEIRQKSKIEKNSTRANQRH